MKWRGISEKSGETPAGSLADQLTEIQANARQYVRPENQKTTDEFIAGLANSGLTERVLAAGSQAPGFALLDQNGQMVDSARLRQSGPLAIVFFRGRWCPYCMTTLEAWAAALPQIEAAGARLVAISPQTAKHNSLTADQHKLRFPVLSDPGNLVARGFGLVYALPEAMRELYARSFVNLPFLNGDSSWELPMPAVFLVASDGTVLFSEASADFMRRTEPAMALATLQA